MSQDKIHNKVENYGDCCVRRLVGLNLNIRRLDAPLCHQDNIVMNSWCHFMALYQFSGT